MRFTGRASNEQSDQLADQALSLEEQERIKKQQTVAANASELIRNLAQADQDMVGATESLVFAQIEDYSAGFEILNQSSELSKKTFQSWNNLWESAVSADSALWQTVVSVGITLALISIIYLALTDIAEAVKKQDWYSLYASFILPIIIMFFLSNNGFLLAETAKLVRQFGVTQVSSISEIQLANMTFQQAQEQIRIGSVASSELKALYAECQSLTGSEFKDCWQGKNDLAGEIIAAAEGQMLDTENNGVQQYLRSFGERLVSNNLISIVTDFEGYVQDRTIETVRFLLYALQWAFINTVEMSLILTTLFLPISLGISMVNIQGKLILANLVGIATLFGIQFAYNLILGLVAIVLVESTGSIFNEVPFVIFLSLFAPLLSIALAGGGGLALYQTTVRGVGQVASMSLMVTRMGMVATRSKGKGI